MKLILLFSHKLTDLQKIDAKESLDINDFIYLPSNLQNIWSQIPANIYNISPYLNQIKEYVQANTNQGDYILIQGDFGATYEMVQYAKEINLIPIYSTNSRESIEEEIDGKVVKKSIFIHNIFRRY